MQHAVLRLDVSGMPMEWIDSETAAALYAKEDVAWTHGEPLTVLHGGVNRFGKQSILEIHPIIAVRGRSRFRKGTPPLRNSTLFARDGYLCLYCGKSFSPRHLTRDHIIPTSRGGKDTWANVVTACRSCNCTKGARTPDEAGMSLLAVPYAPNPWEYLYMLQNRRVLADQLAFLQAGFRNPTLAS